MFGKPRGFLLLSILFTLTANFSCQAKLSKEIPVPPPLYEPDNPIVLQKPSAELQEGKGIIENGSLRCEIDLNSLRIKRLLNKYIQGEVVHGGSRLFVINAQGKDVPESDYELLEAKASSDENQAGLYASWQSKKDSFKVWSAPQKLYQLK